jgi:streptogramin lyase
VTTVETGLTRTCGEYESPWSIAFGGDGTVWFTDPGARRICFFQPGAS